MKRFVLHSLRLLSRREKAATQIRFHPQTTVIRGDNDVGKSSLLKSLVWCFGANPATMNNTWRSLDICAAVEFSIEGRALTIVRHDRRFAIFSAEGGLLRTFSDVTKGLSPFLASLFDFGLRLSARDGTSQIPPPAFYLLPFYIDQDTGWNGTWASFANLGQFSNWRPNLAKYHIGLHDNEYYSWLAHVESLKLQMDEPMRQERTVTRALEEVRSRMVRLPVDLNLQRFRREIDELVKMAEGLASDEENYRKQIAGLANKRTNLLQQSHVISKALSEVDEDYKFAVEQPYEVECPTCGAVYENSVLERFRIALDATRCRDALAEIGREVHDLNQSIDHLRANLLDARARNSRIWDLLEVKREAMTLAEVLAGEARGLAVDALHIQVEEVRKTLDDLRHQIEGAKGQVARYDDKRRRKQLIDEFWGLLNKFSVALSVRSPRQSQRVWFNIRETGSDLPRSVLAYCFAVIHMSWRYSLAARSPIIIDSPNQQDQDPDNLEKILTFIRDNRPARSQLVLGLVDPQGIEFGGEEIRLTRKRRILASHSYETVGKELEDLVIRMYQA